MTSIEFRTLENDLCGRNRSDFGTVRPARRRRGSPQGSAISPLLANLFMHYAFDAVGAHEISPDPITNFRQVVGG
jgi:hypothetical protein